MSFFSTLLLKNRLPKHDGRPLWKYMLNNDDFEKLLEELRFSRPLSIDPRDVTLYYAEWWKKSYQEGIPNKQDIFKSLSGNPKFNFNQEDFYKLAIRGARMLGVKWITKQNTLYFRTLLLQGGLPLTHISENQGKYQAFLLAVLEEQPDTIEDFIFKPHIINLLPISSQNDIIYENCFEIVKSILHNENIYDDLLGSNDALISITKSLKVRKQQLESKQRLSKAKNYWLLSFKKEKIAITLRIGLADTYNSESLSNILGFEVTEKEYQFYVNEELICVFRKMINGSFKTDWYQQQNHEWNGESTLPYTYVIKEGKKYSQVSNKRDKMASLLEDISIKVAEQGKAYDSGKYVSALDIRRKISTLLLDLGYTRNAAFEISKSADDLVYPSSEVMNIYHFYSLLTSNRVGAHSWVLSEYLYSYTNCYTLDNKACQQDVFNGKITGPPFANTCSIRECPEKVYAIEGLSMEAVFELELAFTESAALAGHKDFAQKNFKGIMDYYAGKVQLSPYYLYLAGIVTAIDQKEFAAGFLEKYMAATGNAEEGKIQLKLFFQKMAMFYFSKGNEGECRKFMAQYYAVGKRSVQERTYTVDLLERNRFTAGRENKLILQYIILETDSLLHEKDYLADTNTYCLKLMEASDLYRHSKNNTEAIKLLEQVKKLCPDQTWEARYTELKCIMGDCSQIIAEKRKYLYSYGAKDKFTYSGIKRVKLDMKFFNTTGHYKETIELFEYMKQRGVKKFDDDLFTELKACTGIAYFHLGDLETAKKMMGDSDKGEAYYIQYRAKIYARLGDIAKAKQLYSGIKNEFVVFDDEDIKIQDQ